MNINEIHYPSLAISSIVFLPSRDLTEININLLLNKKKENKNYNYNDHISVINLSNNKFKKLKLFNLNGLRKLVLAENFELETLELVDCYNLDYLNISDCISLKEIIGLDQCMIQTIECENTKIDFLNEKNDINILFIKGLEQIQHVIENIYIGNSKHEEEELLNLGITHVFNISKNNYREYKTITENKYFIDDHIDENILLLLPVIIDKIKELQDKGEKIYVHCYAGVSRSATVVLYYLMFYHNYSLKYAIRYLRSKRMGIQPNPGFIKQLESLEKKFCIIKHN
jgi:protein-tyrosine phosphatase